MKKILLVILALLCPVSTVFATYPDWPDTTLVSWKGESNKICHEKMVWCLLKSTSDSSSFVSFMSAHNGSIWKWYDFSDGKIRVCIVEYNGTNDPSTESGIYQDSCSQVEHATPIFLEIERCAWPEDTLLNDAQWYLEVTDDNRVIFDGDTGALDADINWLKVVDDAQNGGLEQRGNANVRIGLMDNGFATDAQGNLNHPDLSGDRFHLTYNYNENGSWQGTHGASMGSLIAANVDDDHGLQAGDDWGMAGINPTSHLYVAADGSRIQMASLALCSLATAHNCKIINFSAVTSMGDAWEAIFDRLIEMGKMPLFICSAGNMREWNGVRYPAGAAFSGYSQVISVGATNCFKEKASFSSYDPGSNRVSVSAPGTAYSNFWPDPSLGILQACVYNQQIGDYFRYASGTSQSTAIVTGVASLVLSAAFDDGDTLTAYEIRRILEKTSRDINSADKPGFDDEIGYGLIDCYAAVTNRDLYNWPLDDDTWHWISSNIAVNDSNRLASRILEELILDNDDFDNGLDVFKSWNAAADSELVYKPNDREDEIFWNVQRMYKIKLNTEQDKFTDTLWICGKEQDITADITLYDSGNQGDDGWNWTAYYPDYEAAAENALTSIATMGDPDSDLYLAKGGDGSFYTVDFSFSNLTMKPGEGYMLQLDEDRNATLNYPAEDPDQGDAFYASIDDYPQHFRFRARTGDFLPALITGIFIENRTISRGDELGVFLDDTLCVGATVIKEAFPIGLAIWKDDETTRAVDGFRSMDELTFKYWDSSEGEEITQFRINSQSICNDQNTSILVTDLKFDGPARRKLLPGEYALGPIYPNPFNSSAKIIFAVANNDFVSLRLYDLMGHEIKVLYEGYCIAGKYELTLIGNDLPSGVYLVNLKTNSFSSTHKLEVLR